MGTILCCFKDF